MNDLETKLDWEYETFYLDMVRTSKANIFSKSSEIEAKKKIMAALKRVLPNRKKEVTLVEKLEGFDNILDEVYRYTLDCEKNENSTTEVVEKWVNFVEGSQNIL